MSNKEYLDSYGLRLLKRLLPLHYVSRETGKGLSTNDYTDADREKLSRLPDDIRTLLSNMTDEELDLLSDKVAEKVQITAGEAMTEAEIEELAMDVWREML